MHEALNREGVKRLMSEGSLERRRGRRANVPAPVLIRRLGERGPDQVKQEMAKNISLAGVYFETDAGDAYAINDVVMASVSIPASSTRDFPFARLAGRGRIVRVKECPQEGAGEGRRVGVALEFGEDLTALTVTPTRG